jgi:hypothetical protein
MPKTTVFARYPRLVIPAWLFTVGIAWLVDGDYRLGTFLVVGGVFFALISAARLTDNVCCSTLASSSWGFGSVWGWPRT